MDDNGKRKLFRRLCNALMGAGVDLAHVHFLNFHRKNDEPPYHLRFVCVSINEIQRKVKDADGGAYAIWEGSGRHRVSVFDSSRTCRRVSTVESKTGEIPLDKILAKVAEYVTEVSSWIDEEARKQIAEVANIQEVGQLATDFRLGDFPDRENLGWRKNIQPVEVEAHHDGITVHFNRRLTANEARALLRCGWDLGLLPGGVREKDRPVEPDTKNRYERV